MTQPETPTIVPATLEDAPALLAMQRIAFEPEARACQAWDIPPLQETVEGVREHIRMEIGRASCRERVCAIV